MGPSPASTDPVVIDGFTTLQSAITGNGYDVRFDLNLMTPSTYVLAPFTTYYMRLEMNTLTSNTTWFSGMPTVVLANEFGGDFGDSYSGYQMSFFWRRVPEPNTLVLSGIGLFSLAALAHWRIAAMRVRRMPRGSSFRTSSDV